MKVRTFLAMALVLSFVLGGVAMAEGTYGTSDQGVVPVFMDDGPGGNVQCTDLQGTYEFYSERYDDGDQWTGTFKTISWSTDEDGKYVSWEGEHGGMAIILKGGPGAHVYYYTLDPYFNFDSHLVSPLNPGGNVPQLSNITFCYNPPPQMCEWIGETAWAAGTRYVQKGNWATYTPYVADNTVILYAGQTRVAGTVNFSQVVDGKVTISITLNEGFRLKDVNESVKIQGYDAPPPAENPQPGHFTTYKGEELVVTVGAFAYYGVHLDVERESCE